MRRRNPHTALSRVALAGLLAAIFGTALWSADEVRRGALPLPEVRELTRMEPIRVLPRAELLVLAVEARRHLDAERPWAAWRVLRDHIDDPAGAPAGTVLLAARAAAGWGGWGQTQKLLSDRPWLTRLEGGEGVLLLARAEEELGNRSAAIEGYRRYAGLPGARSPGEALARAGRLLRAAGDHRGAAVAFANAAPRLPEIEEWLVALQVQELGEAGDRSAAALAARQVGGSSPVRLRRVQAEADGLIAAGDVARAIRRLEWEVRVLSTQGARAEAARLRLDLAELLLEHGGAPQGRELIHLVAVDAAAPTALRLAAAERLGRLDDRSADENLARAAAYEAAGKPGLAARSLRAALAAGLPDDGTQRLRVGRLLYAERDLGPARAAFQEAAGRLEDRELRAEAELYAARSLYRSAPAPAKAAPPKTKGKSKAKAKPKARKPVRKGPSPREVALAEIRRIPERYEGTAAAGSALFILGDEAPNLRAAAGYYRRAAEVRASPEAREALYRAGDRSLKLKDTGAAVAAWEEYVARYPRGEETARVAYEVGKLHEGAGREAKARAMYTAALLADPLSYYALRSANRLGIDPLAPTLEARRPWVGLAADPSDAAAALRRLEALDRVGLREEWEAELEGSVRAFEQRPVALLVLAEGVRDQGHPVDAIRLGRLLAEQRGNEWDERLLRVVFPFPYRSLLEAEAKRAGVDPMLLAGLVRQESSWRTDARSWVGATGLAQIMPATGKWLAGAAGVRGYDPELLEVPEINLRMGAKYLGDLLDRYDDARDLALAGYNAGPGRADRWRRELRHGRDTDAFREAIPFDETRNYVKVVLRNAAIYERLYGKDRAPGLVRQN